MIVIEVIEALFWWFRRFIFWLITARDCLHCANSDEYENCTLTCKQCEDCAASISCVNFKRRKNNERV